MGQLLGSITASGALDLRLLPCPQGSEWDFPPAAVQGQGDEPAEGLDAKPSTLHLSPLGCQEHLGTGRGEHPQAVQACPRTHVPWGDPGATEPGEEETRGLQSREGARPSAGQGEQGRTAAGRPVGCGGRCLSAGGRPGPACTPPLLPVP